MSSVTSASSTSSSASTTDIFNGKIFGLQSGLDVDSMVTGLVSDVQAQIDKQDQAKQTLQWKQTAYQNIVTALNTFNDSFLAMSGAGSLTASNALQTYTAASSNSTLVSATAASGSDGTPKSITVYQSAKAAQTSTTVSGVSTITGTSPIGSLSDAADNVFNVTIDGVTKAVTISAAQADTFNSADDSTKAGILSTAINSAFGYAQDGIVQVGVSGGTLSLASADNLTSWITIGSASGLTDGQTDALAGLGLTAGASNRMNLNQTVGSVFDSDAFDANGNVSVKINGTAVTLGQNDTLYTALSKINSAAGLKIAYNSTTNTMSATAANTGAAYSFTLVSGDDDSTAAANATTLLEKLGFSSSTITTTQQGRDAVFSFDGGSTYMTRAANSFTVDGVNYTINADVSSTTTTDESGNATTQYTVNGIGANAADLQAGVTFTQDTSSAVKTVQNFVSAYNALLSTITTAISTKPDSDYKPLTDSQKENMSDTEISDWNNKAQQGILYNDDTLEDLEQELRSMVSQQVTTSDGTTITLGSLGIREDTSGDYTTSPGKLVFDDSSTDTLTQMLQNHPDEVQDLFTKQSNYAYLIDDSATVTQSDGATVGRQTARKNQEGLAYRLQDIVSDFTSTNSSELLQGKLTKLLGSSGDGDTANSIYDQIAAVNQKITDLQTKMTNKKNQLYAKFSLLESAMAKFNSESSAITSLASGG